MTALILRFDAPLVSFGGNAVDQRGITQAPPALSMLTGLLGNALGWSHKDTVELEALQSRIRFTCRIDRVGELLTDYQTVDLGLPWMRPEDAGWTTDGELARRGGASDTGTHQRYRQYRADSISTLAVTLVGEGVPSVRDIATALAMPARPLFIGRKCCVPATRILVGLVEGDDLKQILAALPRLARGDRGPLRAFWWDEEGGPEAASVAFTVTDERDWSNRIHVGRRLMREGVLNPPGENHA